MPDPTVPEAAVDAAIHALREPGLDRLVERLACDEDDLHRILTAAALGIKETP